MAGASLNLNHVSHHVWRSGQPEKPEQWRKLMNLGIKRVIKLSFPEEGSDAWAAKYGLETYAFPMFPRTGFDESENVRPERRSINGALSLITTNTLVHCTNGEDRTGLVIGMYRVLVDGWTKRRALFEMLELGFRELPGLTQYWNEWVPARNLVAPPEELWMPDGSKVR